MPAKPERTPDKAAPAARLYKYDPADALKVRALIKKLGVAQGAVVKESNVDQVTLKPPPHSFEALGSPRF